MNGNLEEQLRDLLYGITGAAYYVTVYNRDDEASLDVLRSLAYALGHTVNASKKFNQIREG